MGIIQHLFKPNQGILCPNCEKPMEGHDNSACRRKMSRRFFLGAATGGLVAIATAPTIIGDLTETPVIVVPKVLKSRAIGLTDILQAQINNIKPHMEEIYYSNNKLAEIIKRGGGSYTGSSGSFHIYRPTQAEREAEPAYNSDGTMSPFTVGEMIHKKGLLVK